MRRCIALLLAVAVLLCSGCWSLREMESLAYILVLGIDLTPEGEVELYAQVGLPSAEPTRGGGGEEPVVKTVKAKGKNVTDALDQMFLENTKQPFLSHLRLVVVSERLAREGLERILDFFRRDVNVRMNIRVAVTQDDLEELLSVQEPLSRQPSLAIANQFFINSQRAGVVEIELMQLLTELLEPDREAVLPLIETSEDRFALGKTAVFRGDKMAATLDEMETFGLLLWRNKVKRGVVSLTPSPGSEAFSYRILSSDTRITTRWDGKKLKVRAEVRTVADIMEMHGKVKGDLGQLASRFIVTRMEDALGQAQRSGSDFLGIGVALRRQNNRAWRELRGRWPEVLREAEFEILSHVHIRGQGQVR